MRRTERQRLPPRAEDAFKILTDCGGKRGDGLPWEAVFAYLKEDGFGESEAEYAIQHLLLRGYLYEVDNQLFLNPTKD